MRLLLAASEPLDIARGSGTAMAVARLRVALHAAGVSVPILAPPRRGPSATFDRWRFNRRADRIGGGYDAVLGVGGDGWRVAEQLGVPFVALLKAMYSRALPWERGATAAVLRVHARWESEGLRRADRVIAPSHHTAAAAVQDYGVAASRIRVIPEPFDNDAWRSALPTRERLGNRVLCVAHMYPRKRVGDLIDAWPLVLRACPRARLDIIGDGPDLRHVARRAVHLPSVFVHGHVGHPDILEFYSRADSFCLPSAQETFGYAVVEAFASGLPVVVADAGALPEIITGGVAETVPVGDARALAGAIARSLERDVRQTAASINVQRAAVFDSRIVAQRIVDAVNELRW